MTSQTAAPVEGAAPPGFSAVSVSFVSLRTGWVLGTVPCATPPCTRLLRTTDAGRTWVNIPAPPAPLSEGYDSGIRRIRFANLDDGWAFLPDLWATHDGGAHWTRPMGDAQVMALETASGLVHAVGAGSPIQTSPVQSDAWRASPTTVPAGAGPVPEAHLVLHGEAGWISIVNRTVTGGARLEEGRWVPWQPPCSDTGGPALLAASTSSDLAAFCDEGVWTGGPEVERAYVSTDGGASFHRLPTRVPFMGPSALASPSPNVFVVGGSDANDRGVLMATFDVGRTWKTVDREGVGEYWTDLGFTSPRQGVVVTEAQVGRLLMSFDGGMTWNPRPLR